MDLSDRYDAATALKESGDPAGAVVALEAILADHPDHVLSHSALAVYLVQVGREDDAVAHAVRVTELDPDDAFAFTQLAVICQRCERPRKQRRRCGEHNRLPQGAGSRCDGYVTASATGGENYSSTRGGLAITGLLSIGRSFSGWAD